MSSCDRSASLIHEIASRNLDAAGVSIADDGTVEFRREERVEFSHIVRSKHIGMILAMPCTQVFLCLCLEGAPMSAPCDTHYTASTICPYVDVLSCVHGQALSTLPATRQFRVRQAAQAAECVNEGGHHPSHIGLMIR